MNARQIPLLAFFSIIAPLLSSGNMDLSTPEMQAIRKGYYERKKECNQVLADQLRKLVERNLEDARERLTEQKRTRNVTGMAVAGKAVRIFENCLDQVEKEGNFDIPEKVRRELMETIEQLRGRKTSIRAEYDKAIAELEASSLNRFTALTAPGEEPSDMGKMKTLFRDFLVNAPSTNADEKAASDHSGMGMPSSGEEETRKQPSGTPDDTAPDVIASSGEADAWLLFARWHATVSGMEVVNVPIAGRAEAEKESHFSPMTESEVETRYEAIQEINPTTGSVFRVKSIAGKNPADVLRWPSAGNNWTMQFRVRPGNNIPSEHAIELQVNRSDVQPPLPREKLPVLPGDAQEKEPSPEEAQSKPKKLSHASAPGEYKVIVVMARAGWRFSGVSVKKGDFLKTSVSGLWNCGSRGEKTDAEGYPNDDRFRHYYRGAAAVKRQLESANYGALLIRIGEKGRLGAIGTKASMISPQDGILYFDVNEATDAQSRLDNNGSLTVHISRYDLVE